MKFNKIQHNCRGVIDRARCPPYNPEEPKIEVHFDIVNGLWFLDDKQYPNRTQIENCPFCGIRLDITLKYEEDKK